MRCSNCGKKIKKKSNFCIKCGAKVPPALKKDKKSKKGEKGNKKKLTKRIMIPAAVVVLLVLVSVLLFGCDGVKQKLTDNKAYTKVSKTIQDKLPFELPKLPELPFDLPKLPELPFDLPELPKKLPFELPKLLGEKEPPDDEQVLDDLKKYLEKEENITIDNVEIKRGGAADEEKEETIYATADATSKKGTVTKSYSILYKKGIFGGWKLKEAVDAEKAEKEAKAEDSKNTEKAEKSKDKKEDKAKEEDAPKGVDSKTVVADENLYYDVPSDWTYNNVKVIAHNVDMEAGTDRVVVYMELKTQYVYLSGTKEITYQLDSKTGKWKSTGPASKLACLSIEPIAIPGQETNQENLPV